MARVSIGLPVYNGQNFVADAIESVLAQTFDDWELIISDNASQDQTAEICQRYAQDDQRIRYYRESDNRGAAWNFNRVFELGDSEYFRWLSHDDVLTPEVIAACVEHLDEHDDVLCATTTKIIDSDGYQLLDQPDGLETPNESIDDASAQAGIGFDSDLKIQGLTAEGEALRKRLANSSNARDRYAGILMHSLRCHEVYGLVRRNVMRSTQLHPNYCGGEKVLLAELALKGTFAEIEGPAMLTRWHPEQCSSLSSTEEQRLHMNPTATHRIVLPHQYRATLGYLQLIGSTGLSLGQRCACLLVWCRFVFQFKKWAGVLRNTLTRQESITTAQHSCRRGPLLVPRQSAVPQRRLPHDSKIASQTRSSA